MKTYCLVDQTVFLKQLFSLPNGEYDEEADRIISVVNFKAAAVDLVTSSSWHGLGLLVKHLGIDRAICREIKSLANSNENEPFLNNELLGQIVKGINPEWQAKDKWRQRAIDYVCASGKWLAMGSILSDKSVMRLVDFILSIVNELPTQSCQKLLSVFDTDLSAYEEEVTSIYAVNPVLADKLQKIGNVVTQIEESWFWSVPSWIESVDQEIKRAGG